MKPWRYHKLLKNLRKRFSNLPAIVRYAAILDPRRYVVLRSLSDMNVEALKKMLLKVAVLLCSDHPDRLGNGSGRSNSDEAVLTYGFEFYGR